ncbi:MAG: phage tail tape measure protein, partial [Pseudomonadota bacterium]
MTNKIETAAVLKLVDELTGPAKKAQASSNRLEKSLGKTQKQLTQLQGDRLKIGAFTQLRKQSHNTRLALNEQQQEVRRLAKEYRSTKEPTKKLSREFETAKRKAADLKQQHNRQVTSLGHLRGQLKKAGIETRNLSKHDRRLARDIDKTTASLRHQARALKRHNTAMKRYRQLADTSKGVAGKAAVVGAGGLGAAWLGGRGIGAAGEYKALLADVAVTAGMSDREVTKLKNKISELTDVTFKSREVLGDGAKVLIASGLDLKQTLGALPAIGKTATAADAEVQEVARTAFSLIDNLKIPTEELGHAMDMLTESGKLGRFELRDMAQYFPSLTAQAKRLGLDGAEGVATLGAALQIALKGAADPAEAANNMRNFLAKVTSPETIKRAADIYGINLERELK